jgi:hypothetical protein
MQEIKFTMTDEYFEVLAQCFCRDKPIRNDQVVIDGELQVDEDGKPITTNYTSLDWIEKYMIDQTSKISFKGFDKLTLDGNKPDKELIQAMLANLKNTNL